jgi:putative GTP pyrophosphokinase
MNDIIHFAPVVFKNWRDLLLIHKFALEEVETKVNILNQEFLYTKDYNPIEHIKTRIKTQESIRKKLMRKGLDPTINNAINFLKDIAGIRIICSFKDDIFTIAEMIRNQDDIEVVKISDYVTNPKPNGYQSYHMVVSVPVFLSSVTQHLNVEIQIRTSAMDFWASLEHKINYKYNNKAPHELLVRLKECPQISSELDEKMSGIKESIDAIKKIDINDVMLN